MSLSDKIKNAQVFRFVRVDDIKQFIKKFLDFFGSREIHTEISYQEIESKMKELAGKGLI